MAKNQYSSTGTITRDNFPDLVSRMFDKIWMRKEEFAGVLAQFFNIVRIDSGSTWNCTTVGGEQDMPMVNEDTQPLPYFTPPPGFDKAFVVQNRRAAIRVTDTMISMNRHPEVMATLLGGMMKATMELDEYQRAAIFNNSFTSGLGADQSYMCADSHEHEDPEAGTWDNLGTGALTGPNLQSLRLLAYGMENAKGRPMPVMPKGLLVRQDLEQKALELSTARQKPEGMLNEDNVLINAIPVIVSPHLTSTTAYWLIGNLAGEYMGLHEIVLQDWNVKDLASDPDIPINKRVKSIKTFGFSTTKNVFGSTGA